MIISLIVAASENNVIGKKNGLPWNMPNDMRYFKNTTWGMPVIMGRKTYESMDNEPLPGRVNIVVTSKPDWKQPSAIVVSNLDDAFSAAKDADCNEVFVIGGGAIYKEAIAKVDRIYITRIYTVVEGDVFFPEIDESKWKLVSNRDCKADEKNQFDYSFQIWEKQ